MMENRSRTNQSSVKSSSSTPRRRITVYDHHNSAAMNVVRQLAALSRHANQVFSRVHADVEQMARRSGRLRKRLGQLEASANKLPNPKTVDITSPRLITNSDEKKGTESQPIFTPTLLFTPATRPVHLRDLYLAARHNGKQVKMEDCCTQTEAFPLDSTSSTGSSMENCDSRSPIESQQRNSELFDVQPNLPTPEQRALDTANRHKSTVVAIDVSYSTLTRTRGQAKPGKSRQNHICEKHAARNRSERSTTPSPAEIQQNLSNTTSGGIDEPQSYSPPPEEDQYDFLPFQRRSSKLKLRSAITPLFGSIRRKKAKKETVAQHPVTAKIPNSSTNPECLYDTLNYHRSSADSAKGWKGFLTRSVSLRLRSKTEEGIYDQLPCNARPIQASYLSRKDSLRRKLSLPISTTSQVLHLATAMRDQRPSPETTAIRRKQQQRCQRRQQQKLNKNAGINSEDIRLEKFGGKSCPTQGSTNLSGSDMSLELDNRSSNEGWYRRGYEIDFPVEHRSLANSRKPNRSPASSQSSPRDPVAESDMGSIADDSSYSCDHEGYYTSMHRDSGLTRPRRLIGQMIQHHVRSRSIDIANGNNTANENRTSTNGLCSDESLKGNRESSGDSGAEDLQSPCQHDARPNFLKPVPEIPAHSDRQDQFTRGGTSATLPRPFRQNRTSETTPKTLPKPDAFDQWLLRKFQEELNIQNSRNPGDKSEITATYTLPRNPRPSPHENSLRHVTQKIVRFCDAKES